MSSNLNLFVCCSMWIVIGVTGCGSGSSHPDLTKFNSTNIDRLHAGYCMYWAANGNQGPKDEKAFKEFLTTHAGAKVRLGRIGVSQDQVLEIFMNERDGQPFKLRYGVNGPGDLPVVFEAVGADGKRFVAFDVARELEKDEYEKCWAGKTTKADKGAVDPFVK